MKSLIDAARRAPGGGRRAKPVPPWGWAVYLGAGAVGGLGYLVMHAFNGGRLWHLIGVSSAAAIVASAHLQTPRRPFAWHIMGLAFLLVAIGDVLGVGLFFTFGSDLPSLSIAHFFPIAARALLIAGLFLLLRHRNPGAEMSGVIDWLMIATGAGMLAWVVVLAPYASQSDLPLAVELAAMVYPLLDIALLAVLGRLAMGRTRRCPTVYLLSAGGLALLATDAFYGVPQLGYALPAVWLNVAGLSFCLLWGAAALHPSVAWLDDSAGQGQAQNRSYRILVIGSAAFVGPALQIYQSTGGTPVHAGILGAGSATMVTLVLIRVRRLMVDIGQREASEVTLRRSLNHEQELVEKLRELDRLKSAFVSSVSHELRTPLTSIMGYLELMEGEHGEPLGPNQKSHMQVVERNAQRLLNLIEDLLTVSTIESGNFNVTLATVDIQSVIRAAHAAVAPMLDERSLQVVTDLPGRSCMVTGDAAQLRRALRDLLSNAIKFSPPKSTIIVSAEDRGGHVAVAVTDQGVGIPPEEQAGLFSRFFRSSLAGKKAIGGAGLGLTIAKTIVDHHGGVITLRSTPERGTTVTFTVPRASTGRQDNGRENNGRQARPAA